MWPFKRQPRRLTMDEAFSRAAEDVAKHNRAALASVAQAERIPYDGDAFLPETVVPKKETTVSNEVIQPTERVQNMPALITKTLDWLKKNKAGLENDLKKLQNEYKAAKASLDEKVAQNTTAIKAWEAANAVYAAERNIDAISVDPAAVAPKKTRAKK